MRFGVRRAKEPVSLVRRALAQGQRKEGRVRGRCIALARRCVSANYRIVNCAPAKGCVWPVLAPARAWVRARGTAEQFGIRGAGAGLRGEGVPIMMFCVRFTPAVCRRVSNRTACDSLRFYSAGRDRHSCVLECWCGYRALWVHFGFAFLCGNPGRVTTGVGYAKKSAVMGAFLL